MYDQRGLETKFDMVSNLRECLWSRKFTATEEPKREPTKKERRFKKPPQAETHQDPLNLPSMTIKEKSIASQKGISHAEKMKNDAQADTLSILTEDMPPYQQPSRTNYFGTEEYLGERVQTEQREGGNLRFWSSIPSPKRNVVFSRINFESRPRKATLEFSPPKFESKIGKNSK